MLVDGRIDYVIFIKHSLKLLQSSFESIRRMDIDMHVVEAEVKEVPKAIKISKSGEWVTTTDR